MFVDPLRPEIAYAKSAMSLQGPRDERCAAAGYVEVQRVLRGGSGPQLHPPGAALSTPALSHGLWACSIALLTGRVSDELLCQGEVNWSHRQFASPRIVLLYAPFHRSSMRPRLVLTGVPACLLHGLRVRFRQHARRGRLGGSPHVPRTWLPSAAAPRGAKESNE
jgi:hypothetical protein